jgi:hypothetical protein
MPLRQAVPELAEGQGPPLRHSLSLWFDKRLLSLSKYINRWSKRPA